MGNYRAGRRGLIDGVTMKIKVSDGYITKTAQLFSGREYIKGEYRNVPQGCEGEARHLSALGVVDIEPAPREKEKKGQGK